MSGSIKTDYELGYMTGKIKAEVDFKKGIKSFKTEGSSKYKKGYKDGYELEYEKMNNKYKEDELSKLIKKCLMEA